MLRMLASESPERSGCLMNASSSQSSRGFDPFVQGSVDVDDILQATRERLLLGQQGAARLLTYTPRPRAAWGMATLRRPSGLR